VFVIYGKDHDQQHNDDRMARSEAKLHFGYQKLNSISEFWIPGVGGVKSRDSSSQESRSCEMRNAEIRNRHINKDSISEFRRPGNQRSKEL
jgi:hypothetical protein